jgi:DNA phosphorothioation-associated DGQHR protein 1
MLDKMQQRVATLKNHFPAMLPVSKFSYINSMVNYPVIVPALKVDQQLGTYYVAVLPAQLLLETCYSDRLRAIAEPDGASYILDGTQRGLDPERLNSIARYISRVDSAFPNSIILAANFSEIDGTIEEDSSKRWSVKQDVSGIYSLTIPTAEKLAAVIDGQHRLFAFALVDKDIPRLDTQLICSLFLDLPKPFQAQLFATINSTQKPVPKSLTYELFGYNISDEDADHWSPDKLAVFLSRKLNAEDDSPLKGRIIIAPENDFLIEESKDKNEGESAGVKSKKWRLSMATIVEGILRLISSNPKRDTSDLLTPSPRPRCELRQSARSDKSPLRDMYIDGNDQMIHLIVKNYLTAVEHIFWHEAKPESFIFKTVGIQALLDILRKLCGEAIEAKDISIDFFTSRLTNAKNVDFGSVIFQNASGSGRTKIRKCIELKIGLIGIDDLDLDDDLRKLIA